LHGWSSLAEVSQSTKQTTFHVACHLHPTWPMSDDHLGTVRAVSATTTMLREEAV